MSLGFYVDMTSCIGCRTCQVACKDRRDLQVVGPRLRRVDSFEAGTYPEVGLFNLVVSCNHCDSPACVANCPTGAMTKDEATGIVSIDQETCIGCKTCSTVCPYGAPTFVEEEGVSSKCDMCTDEVARGRVPICVATCPMRALDWGDIEELRQKYGEGNVEVEPLPKNTTSPCLVLDPHPAAQATGQGTGKVVNLEEELDL